MNAAQIEKRNAAVEDAWNAYQAALRDRDADIREHLEDERSLRKVGAAWGVSHTMVAKIRDGAA